MNPVTRSSFHAGRTMLAALAVIIVGLVLLWGLSALITKRHNARITPASGGVVEVGDAARLTAQFDRGGGVPIYFPDVSGNAERSVYLVHTDGPSDKGWTAFDARVPGKASSCQWRWNDDAGNFDASCDPERHSDAHGTGLAHYPVKVVQGKIQVDLTSPLGPASTTPAG